MEKPTTYIGFFKQNGGQKHNRCPQKQFLSVCHCSRVKGEHR